MTNPTGTLANTIIQLCIYETGFPSGVSTPSFSSSSIKSKFNIVAPTTLPDPYKTQNITTANAAIGLALPVYQQAFKQLFKGLQNVETSNMSLLTQFNTALESASSDYKNIMTQVAKQANILPPTGAMAGIYTLVDDTEGVWYAPANRNINSVVAPMVSINDDQQAPLNVDALSGKSINAIRSFYGRGPAIVWGARTMDGNSLDWRYINVRRFMIMLEQSVANAAFTLVFEPNVATTWKICESMISNFLHNLWSEGALQGASPADAYSVMVGLGKTMTPLDILNGIMRVQVKVAPVRPAEFIIITYEQEMPKS